MDMDLPALDLDPKALDSAPELSFMIEELPSRNSSSLIVHHRLGSETQIPAILKLVAARIADMRFLGSYVQAYISEIFRHQQSFSF